MNRLIYINKDSDVSGVDCAMAEEVEEFEEGTIAAPELDPMRPYLDTTRHTSWNDVLCEMFVEHFQDEEGVKMTPDDMETVEKMFINRLGRLSRIWKSFHKFTPEELSARKDQSNALSRRNTRRVDVGQSRDF